MDGKPQMPTTRRRHVQRLLKSGKARIATHTPFTIQLKYKNDPVLQDVTLGMDPGRTNIGLSAILPDGDTCFSAVVETRNKQIRKGIEERAAHRRASRSGERKARQRLAVKYHTVMEDGQKERRLPQYGEDQSITCKKIRNTQARFSNRKRPCGWVTPTVRHLIRTHINAVKKVQKFLPVTHMSVEINRFAFLLMEHPEAFGTDFQNGPLKGYPDVREKIFHDQEGKCLLCGRKITCCHHIVPRSKGGSDSYANLAGLCDECHEAVHTDDVARKTLASKKTGLLKKYHALSALNQAIPYIASELTGLFGEDHISFCEGGDTATMRNSLGYEKDTDHPMHEVDAYCIALLGAGTVPEREADFDQMYRIRQYRRHDRANVHHQTERTYKYDGRTVARNRKPRFEQKGPSLIDWYREMVSLHGTKAADRMRSGLQVTKSTRYYNTKDRILPGAVFEYHGERHVLQSQLTGGAYYRAADGGTKNYPASDCMILFKNTGLVFL